MKKILSIIIFLVLTITSCTELLEPKPVNVLTTDLVLSIPADVPNVRIGLYNAFRGIASPLVIAGDFTADMIIHRGTYTQYQELGNKQITSSNAAVAALWASIYNTVYISNFILEKLPSLEGVPQYEKDNLLATARFLRGMALFIGVNTFGDIPLPTTIDVETNKTIAKTSKAEILNFIIEDYTFALDNIEESPSDVAFVGVNAVKAALSRFYLYQQDWVNAEKYASEVIATGEYELPWFTKVVGTDKTEEAIFEVSFTIVDDLGTGALSLNDLFKGRREVIPSNVLLSELFSNPAGTRDTTVQFSSKNQGGSDNGWSVLKYGTVDEGSNNIVIFRLAEMYLIRAEARAMQGVITGLNSAEEDINILRKRAKALTVTISTQNQALLLIEKERVYELAFEGHRWYDLKRTGRLNEVMTSFSPRWKESYDLWPIPLREIQNNPSLKDAQNPGY